MRYLDSALPVVLLLAASLACKAGSSNEDSPGPAKSEAPAITLPIATLLGEYKDNEVRADGKYKGKRVQVTGTVGNIKKDMLNSIYITVGTGKQFEIPIVQCFVKKGQTAKASALSKGAQVTVRGRVDGLMMNVLVKECDIL